MLDRRQSPFFILSSMSLLVLATALVFQNSAVMAQVRVSVDLKTPIRVMHGGIGASWHAIEEPIVGGKDDCFGLTKHGGSGWGGNPPVKNVAAWKQIERHATWLGLDFIRVEFEQRMYQPERRRFDFDNPEMQALYRILDWCEEHNADVFLQQMWSNVQWNTFPEWQGDPIGHVHSGPRSLDDFANGLATCVEHLVKKKGYTCIRWLSITNEPGGHWGWWQRPRKDSDRAPGDSPADRRSVSLPLTPGLAAVRKALDARGLTVPLSGPQTVPLPPLDPAKVNYDSVIGAYDLHTYFTQFDWMPKDDFYFPITTLEERVQDWTRWAHQHGKPFFLTEVGCKVFGEGDRSSAVVSFEAALHNVEVAIRTLNLGVDGVNRWSLTNRGDLDGQWQMINTFDPDTGKYISNVTPHPNSYHTYGLLSRFTAKHSTTFRCDVDGGSIDGTGRTFAAALVSPKGNLTLAVVNDAETAWDMNFDVSGLQRTMTLYRYCVSGQERDRSDLTIEPQKSYQLEGDTCTFEDRVPAQSITIYSSYQLGSDEPGITVEQSGSRHVLTSDEPFVVMAYPGPPADQVNLPRYREIANAGIDVIVPANGTWDGKTNLEALDLAAEVGLGLIVTDLRIMPWHEEDRVKIDQKKIDAVAGDYRDHPALVGYLLCDEPNVSYFGELASTSERLRIADPNHFPLINLFPSYGSPKQLGFEDFRGYVRSFIETAKPEVLSYDHYPLREPQAGETDWFGDLKIVRDETRRAGIPFWICLQSEGIKGGLRVPNRAEILWQANTALAYGARGVVWFTYWTPSPTQGIPLDDAGEAYLAESHIGGMLSTDGERTPRYDHVVEANRFLHEAGRVLTGWDNSDLAHWKLGKPAGDGQSPCINLQGKEFNAVVGTFSRGDLRRVVIANDSYLKPGIFSIEPQRGWRFSKVLAALDANEVAQDNGPSTWQLAPGGCLVVEYSGEILQKVMIPMRDGTKLAADVYLPDGDGPFPVVVARSVYGRGNEGLATPFTSQGIAFVPQDTRGRGDSEGRDRVFADDGWRLMQDGVDTIAWVRRQTWCNGKVGTWGGSALGITQIWLTAAGAQVEFQSIGVAASKFYGDMVYQGGVWRRALCEPWLKNQGRENVIGLWQSHPYLDSFWRSMDTGPRAAHVRAPALHVGGWWDIFQQGTIDNFVSRQEHGGPGGRGHQKLVMGPWAHGTYNGPKKLGDLELPKNYNFDVQGLEQRLYRHYLLNEANGADQEPAVHYYTLGDVNDPDGPGNEWRTADQWPPFETESTTFYLVGSDKLTREQPASDSGRAEFTYDPSDPCPTHGGANLSLPNGPFDQRKVSRRDDVLRYTTEPLDVPLEVTGRVKVQLFVSSDAPDTDFTAKLVDIYPDGREILLLDSIQRVKLRKGPDVPSPLPPGEVGELEIDLWSISIVFAPGHRIGLHISSSNYPRFETNPNTGDDFPSKDNLRTAKNSIHFGPGHSSKLILPVRE